MSARTEAKLKAARRKAAQTSALIDESLLGVSRGIDRILRDRAELLAALEDLLLSFPDVDATCEFSGRKDHFCFACGRAASVAQARDVIARVGK